MVVVAKSEKNVEREKLEHGRQREINSIELQCKQLRQKKELGLCRKEIELRKQDTTIQMEEACAKAQAEENQKFELQLEIAELAASKTIQLLRMVDVV